MTNFKKTVGGAMVSLLLLSGCAEKQQVDFIGYNGVIYTIDNTYSKADAFAIKDGKFVEVGRTEDILAKYEINPEHASAPDNYKDFGGAPIYPGFNDAHCHLFGAGRNLVNVNLKGITSFEAILEKLEQAYKENPNRSFLLGTGWDQNLWPVKEFPTNEKLNELFPTLPVVLSRVDGHAAIVNEAAIRKMGVKLSDLGTKYSKGEAILKNGKFTGVFLENMCDVFKGGIVEYNTSEIVDIYLAAQKECFKYGLTSLSTEEGYNNLQILDSLVNKGEIIIKIDAWFSAGESSCAKITKPFSNKNLKVSTIKLYSDGALGSRGATLLEPYSDDPKNCGVDVITPEEFRKYCQWAYDHGFKVATHCIGDKANRQTLDIYGEFAQRAKAEGKPELWWRIEHAQIINEADINKFKEYSIIPSIQPTHCTSDMLWAVDRLGARIQDAYRYKTLLGQLGWIPSGTDFPIEEINPIYTFYAAVYRRNLEYNPKEGFQVEEALSMEQALRSMTVWAAKATHEDDKKGSIEAGKEADFVILDKDITKSTVRDVPKTRVISTYINGERVYHNI